MAEVMTRPDFHHQGKGRSFVRIFKQVVKTLRNLKFHGGDVSCKSHIKIGLDLKTYSMNFAGIGRYCINTVDNLLKESSYQYSGFISPETDLDLLGSKITGLPKGRFERTHSSMVRSFLLPFSLKGVDLFHSMDNSCIVRMPGRSVKKVSTIHDLIVFKFPQLFTRKHRTVVRSLISLAVRNADHIITVSHSTKNDLLELYPKLKEDRVSVTHLAADERFRAATDEQVETFLESRQLPKKYFLSVGTQEPRKNLKVVIEAFLEFKKASGTEEAALLIVGGKGWLDSGVHDSETLKKQGVHPLGFIADELLPVLYSGAMAFVYPSLYEGFGLPVVEAMSCGTPVITSNISSLPEVAGESALLVDPNSTDSIKKSMERLYADQELREELSTKSLIQAKNFSWKKLAKITEGTYEKVLSR